MQVEAEFRFIFESGPTAGEPYFIDSQVVGDLLRASDVMFMPSHREGFRRAGARRRLTGQPGRVTDVPAALEIGGGDVMRFVLIGRSRTHRLIAC